MSPSDRPAMTADELERIERLMDERDFLANKPGAEKYKEEKLLALADAVPYLYAEVCRLRSEVEQLRERECHHGWRPGCAHGCEGLSVDLILRPCATGCHGGSA